MRIVELKKRIAAVDWGYVASSLFWAVAYAFAVSASLVAIRQTTGFVLFG